AVAVKLNCKMFVVGCYIPPQIVSSSHESLSRFLIELIDTLLNEHPHFDVMLCGDFNRLRTDFICRNCNLLNIHNKCTYGNAELDYILISENAASSYFVSKADPIDVSVVHHASLLAVPKIVRKSHLKVTRSVFDLRKSNVAAFVNELRQCDWSFVRNESLNINEKCMIFHDVLNDVFVRTIPVKSVNFTDKTKPWITPLIKSLINDRWTAYRQQNFKLYNHLKQKVKKEIEKSKKIWVGKLNGKDVWKVTNDIVGRKTSDPMKCFYNRFDSITTAANFINHAFTLFHSEKRLVPLPCSASKCITVTESQVRRFLSKLPEHKASPDVPSKLYKAAAEILSQPLTYLFSNSIETSSVPDLWKTAALTPLPKTTSPSTADDMRPISLLSIPAKILEKVILDFARPLFLEKYGEDQYGFRHGSSTSCALIRLHDHITSCLDQTNVTGVQVIAYDFSKAFDRIRHDVVIKRLIDCSMPPELILWISNYLENRQQYVKIGNESSSSLEVTSGVPQGSVLGPFLFSIVIGALTLPTTDCHIIKYADDITISIPLYKDSTNPQVSRAHERITSWSREVGLPLNLKKCHTMLFPRTRDCQLVCLPGVQHVDKLTVLGVTFDSHCSWSAHIDNVSRKASRRLFPLRLLKPHLNPLSLKMVYFSIMRSVMEYAAPLFIGLCEKDSKRLQILQNRFHRILCGKECREECLPSLADRRKNLTLSLFRKALSEDGHLLRKILHPLSSHGRVILPTIRTTRRLKTFTIQSAMLFNESKINNGM
ncbi:MAG: reverse transcriptase family protein, partial [Pseudomonadota bacterium]